MTFPKSYASFCLLAAVLSGQALDPAKLLQPPTDSWPTYNGDYSGRRFSPLKKINDSNVDSLSLAWVYRMNTGGGGGAIKATPLVVDGVMYFTVPDHVWALDARTGREIWHYSWESKGGMHIGNRGVGISGNWLYFETPDCHLVSLNTTTGKERWRKEICDMDQMYFGSMAPVIIGNRVIVGVSGDDLDIPGYVESRDAETGDLQWHFSTTPKPGEPGSETWPSADAMNHGGGMTWLSSTYDPEMKTIFFGTGNPQPVIAGKARPGDNLFTESIVAVNVDTGKMKWYFQPSPHDTHDWDAVETPVLFDAPFGGKPRKLLAQASRNGYFFVLDRATGEHLLTTKFADVDWASGVDKKGRPIPDPAKDPQPEGAFVRSPADGSTNWMAPSYDPDTKLFYVNAEEGSSMWYLMLDADKKPEGHQGGATNTFWQQTRLLALDYQTGKAKWIREAGDGRGFPGILTTAGGVLFTGDVAGSIFALDAATGRTLWHSYGGGNFNSSPITYELDGRQYVLTCVDGTVYAWTLPDSVH